MPAEDTDMQRRHSSATETSAPLGTDGGLKRQVSACFSVYNLFRPMV